MAYGSRMPVFSCSCPPPFSIRFGIAGLDRIVVSYPQVKFAAGRVWDCARNLTSRLRFWAVAAR